MDIRRNHEMLCETSVNEPSEKSAARNKNGNGPRPPANARAVRNAVGLMVNSTQPQLLNQELG